MTARDDYPLHPFASGSTGQQWERMCDEIDRLRADVDMLIAEVDRLNDASSTGWLVATKLGEGVRGLTRDHVDAIAKAVYDHHHPAAPVNDEIRNFCRYLIDEYTGS